VSCLARRRPTGSRLGQPMRALGAPACDPTYRRRWDGTPGFLTSTCLPPGGGKGQT
jgi:hypothetical protein